MQPHSLLRLPRVKEAEDFDGGFLHLAAVSHAAADLEVAELLTKASGRREKRTPGQGRQGISSSCNAEGRWKLCTCRAVLIAAGEPRSGGTRGNCSRLGHQILCTSIWLVPLYHTQGTYHEDFHGIHTIGNRKHAPP